MAPLTELTDRQRSILDYIRDTVAACGYCPTIREMCTAFDISSPNGVRVHLQALEAKGYIVRKPKSARAIQVICEPTTFRTVWGVVDVA